MRHDLLLDKIFVILLTNMNGLWDSTLQSVSTSFLLKACTHQVISFITDNFLRNETDRMRIEEAVTFLQLHFCKLNQVIVEHAAEVEQ